MTSATAAAADTALVRHRLGNQRLGQRLGRDGAAGGGSPAELVRWMGAVQAQDFAGGVWAVGMRCAPSNTSGISGVSESDVEAAIAARSIVRSWPMRGTLHFVPAEALRWMLRLLTPRISAGLGWRDRQLGLDASVFTKAAKILTRALEGGRCLSRPAAYAELERGGISTVDPGGRRGIHILSNLALSGHLCFGEREGRQPTFVLLDEWIPRQRSPEIAEIDDDEAFARLAETYFRGHGPATLADFAWWTGLRRVEAKRAIEIAGERLRSEQCGGVERHSVTDTSATPGAGETRLRPEKRTRGPAVELLPPWDEYLVGYRDRTAALGHLPDHLDRKLELLGRPVVLVDGRARGFWRRELDSEAVRVTVEFWDAPIVETALVIREIERAAARYAAFLGRQLELEVRSPSSRPAAPKPPKPAKPKENRSS